VLPKPHDWPDRVRVTGYLFPPSDGYVPPPELVAFLAAGEPPVCIGFGSTIEADPGALRPILSAAQSRTGRRFVLVKGWANYDLPDPSDNIFVVDRVSYPWLYPRTSAVVHHGGAGTVAEAVRAGVPSICVPFITEQRFWAARLSALGVSPPQVPRRDLTAVRLAEAIDMACGSADMRSRSSKLGASVRSEDGTDAAVDLIERGAHQASG
jgi:sterol 3beta-glucosyltransferase